MPMGVRRRSLLGALAVASYCTGGLSFHVTTQRTLGYREGTVVFAAPSRASPSENTQVVIVGAGIGGLTLAYDLEQRGIDYVVLEKAKSPREGGTAIGLWTQAWRALDYMNVGEKLRKPVYEGTSIRISTSKGKELVSFAFNEACNYGPHEFRYVMRSDLLHALLNIVPAKRVRYSMEVEGVKEGEGEGAVVTLTGGKTIKAQVVVGADGVKSKVHELLHPGESCVSYSGYKAIRGIAQLKPNTPTQGINTLDQGVVSQVWGAGTRLGIYRMSPQRAYWYVTYNSGPSIAPTEKEGGHLLQRAHDLLGTWDSKFGIDLVLGATKPEDVVLTRLGDRMPRLGAWGRGRVTLLGDAAHPMTPNLGQGGAAAIEDALELGPQLEALLRASKSPTTTDVSKALRDFEKARGPRCAKLTLKAQVFGYLLQLAIPPVPLVRDTALPIIFSPKNFLEHTKWSPPYDRQPSAQKNKRMGSLL